MTDKIIAYISKNDEVTEADKLSAKIQQLLSEEA